MKVALFVPCLVDQFFPETAFNMVRILEKAGCEVSYNPDQTCCGVPAYHAGQIHYAEKLGEKFVQDFDTSDYIVGTSGACIGHIRDREDNKGMGHLLTDSIYKDQHNRIKQNVHELSEFLVRVLGIDDFGAELVGKGTFLDACHSYHDCQIKETPRALLRKVKGLLLEELNDNVMCCGFGVDFACNDQAASAKVGRNKLLSILNNTKAKYIISTDWGCLMHLRKLIQEDDLNLEVMHLADVIASGWTQKAVS